MGKKCIICGSDAKFCIKNSSEFYCQDCAEESFGDISMLMKVEEEADRLKAAIEEKTQFDEQ